MLTRPRLLLILLALIFGIVAQPASANQLAPGESEAINAKVDQMNEVNKRQPCARQLYRVVKGNKGASKKKRASLRRCYADLGKRSRAARSEVDSDLAALIAKTTSVCNTYLRAYRAGIAKIAATHLRVIAKEGALVKRAGNIFSLRKGYIAFSKYVRTKANPAVTAANAEITAAQASYTEAIDQGAESC